MGRRAFHSRRLLRGWRNLACGRGFQVDPVGDFGEHGVGVFFFGFDGFEHRGILVEGENFRPPAQGSVDRYFVVLHSLGVGDERDVADAGVRGVLDRRRGFGGQAADYLTVPGQ